MQSRFGYGGKEGEAIKAGRWRRDKDLAFRHHIDFETCLEHDSFRRLAATASANE